MNILLPKTITPEMFGDATNIPEVDTDEGEVEWVSGTDYPIKTRRVWKGWTYESVIAITGSPDNTREPGSRLAAGIWLIDENAPTNRMAPFDKYLFTKTRKNGEIIFELKPGFVDGLAIYGIEADKISISITDGVPVVPPEEPNYLVPPIVDKDLWEQAFGVWEYLFGDLQKGTYYTIKGIPINPGTTITIKISRNSPDAEAAVGYISVGQWRKLISPINSKIGGGQYGANSATKDYSFDQENTDGTYTEVPGRKSKNISISCQISATQAPAADDLLTQILGKAVAIEASSLPRYRHLATIGRITGDVSTINWSVAQVNLNIKGNI